MDSLSPNRPSRRRWLRTAGCTIALPCLPSLAVAGEKEPEHASDRQTDPKRFCCIFFPNGVSLPPADHPAHDAWHWFPHQTGSDYRLTRPLEPLAPHRENISILSGLSHPAMRSTIAHITADSFLTGADSSREYTNSISLDQQYALAVGNQTRFPSLTLSSDGGVGTPGRTKTLSFNAAGRPIPSLSNPRRIFNRLFGITEQSTEHQRQQFGRDRSILDNVLDEARAVHAGLSQEDRHRLDHYTDSVRQIEQRLTRADRWLDVQAPIVDSDALDLQVTAADDAQQYIRAILDLIYVAILTDTTRSITYQITSEDAKGIGDRFPAAIGLGSHHGLSHDTDEDRGYENWARYDQFLSRQLAYFLKRLSTTDDPSQEGSLLDNTVVLYGCSTSDTHRAVNYPLVLAGGDRVGFRHGRHHAFDQNKTCMSDLLLTLLHQLGVETERFADGSKSLTELLA